MAERIHIAIIDTGVVHTFYGNPDNSIYIDDNNSVQQFVEDNDDISHGTICYIVLKYNAPDSLISSIKILKSDGRGFIEKLTPALEWCCQNNVKIVNLSLGSTHFMDKPLIRSVVNYYTNKGIVFVCAGSNNGYTSYPACFSNVIGVTADIDNSDNDKYLFLSDIHTGIDIRAYAVCGIPIGEDQKFVIPKSNSYTTPFVTAKVYDIIKNNLACSVFNIKKRLKQAALNSTEIFRIYGNPDWIHNAYIADEVLLQSSAVPYFHVFKDCDYSKIKNIVDTVIVSQPTDISFYASEGKRIVYLGEDSEMYVDTDINEYFWCSSYREYQIDHCRSEKSCLDVPAIIINLPEDSDELWVLQELRCRFAEETYNVYASSINPRSVLYDLEYIPPSCIQNFEDNAKILSFLTAEAYYKKIDAVIIGACGKQEMLNKFASNIDAQLKIDILKAELYKVCFGDNEGNTALKQYEEIDEISLNLIYRQIKDMLTGEAARVQ
jgi:hypothetical protein